MFNPRIVYQNITLLSIGLYRDYKTPFMG